MTWALISVLAATGFAASNIIDKLLIEKKFKEISVNTIAAFNGLVGLPFLFLFFVLVDELPDTKTLIAGFAAGWLLFAAFRLYYKALISADPALVVTLFQMILPLNLLNGYLFFGEKPLLRQLIGAGIIFFASFITSLESKEKRWRLRKSLFTSMLVASVFVSFSDSIFKKAALDQPFFTVAVAEYASSVVAGIVLLFVSRKIRREIVSLWKGKVSHTFGAAMVNEVVNLGATLSMRYATTIGSIFLVQAVMGTQPIIVFILGITVATLFPGLHDVKEYKKHWAIKLFAMLIAIGGAALIA